jgi:hypothetical protein
VQRTQQLEPSADLGRVEGEVRAARLRQCCRRAASRSDAAPSGGPTMCVSATAKKTAAAAAAAPACAPAQRRRIRARNVAAAAWRKRFRRRRRRPPTSTDTALVVPLGTCVDATAGVFIRVLPPAGRRAAFRSFSSFAPAAAPPARLVDRLRRLKSRPVVCSQKPQQENSCRQIWLGNERTPELQGLD